MQIFNIPDNVINGVAAQIHTRTNKDYRIPVVGVPDNLETPQIFEIMPFAQIDSRDVRFFAVDGSRNSHTFYNGITLSFYQAGYVCFHQGKQLRMNESDDPVVFGKIFHGDRMLVLAEKDLNDIYDELLGLPPVSALLSFFEKGPEDVFPYSKDVLIRSTATLLGFCQEILEWACVYDIVQNAPYAPGDFILRDGTLRSLHIKQPFLVKLGHLLYTKNIRVVGVTKQSPITNQIRSK